MRKRYIIKETFKKTVFLIFFTMFITNLVIFIFKPVVLRGMIMGNILSILIPILVGILFLYEIEANTEKIKTLNSDLENMACHDYLTGLYNRRKLFESIDQHIEIAKRYNQTVNFCLFDIDDFKIINDSEGHPEGDRILIRIGEILKSSLRKSDIAGRYGGDEFYIFIPVAEEEQALKAVEKIKQGIRNMKTEAGKTVTCSFGLTSYTGREIPDINYILTNTDRSLYTAKSSGKNTIKITKSTS